MLEVGNGTITVLVSYATPVAAKGPNLLAHTDRRWSSTTQRHIKKWLASEASAAISVPQDRIQEIYNAL